MSIVFLHSRCLLIPLKSASQKVIHREKYEIAWAYQSTIWERCPNGSSWKMPMGTLPIVLVYGKNSWWARLARNDVPMMWCTVLLNGIPKNTKNNWVPLGNRSHYATQLSVWWHLVRLQPDDLQFKDGEVERAVKANSLCSGSTEDTKMYYECWKKKPTEKHEARLNGAYFETKLSIQLESMRSKGRSGSVLNQSSSWHTHLSQNTGEAKKRFP